MYYNAHRWFYQYRDYKRAFSAYNEVLYVTWYQTHGPPVQDFFTADVVKHNGVRVDIAMHGYFLGPLLDCRASI